MKKISNLVALTSFIIVGCNEDTNLISTQEDDGKINSRVIFEDLYQEDLNGKSVMLKYNTLPNNELIRIFTDKEYERKIMKKPNVILKKYILNENIEFVVHPHMEKNQIINFAIPYIDNSGLTEEEIYEKLRKDYKDITVSYILPYNVLSNAILDLNFQERLVNNPEKVLRDYGYEVGNRKIIIHADTKNKKNIILPESPINSLDIIKYKKGTKYLQPRNFGNNLCDNCHGIQTYEPYDTSWRIECSSLPTCR